MNWLRLIRYKNLLIVFFTQLLVWYCLIYDSRNFWGGWAIIDFLPIALSTLLIAAAGYIINDYFDIKIDLINRPDKVVLDKKIPLRLAIIAHVGFNIIAMALVMPIAIRNHHYEWPLVQLACIILLWFYSTHFKRRFLTGNIVIAALTALTVVVLLIYEPSLRMYYKMCWWRNDTHQSIDPKWMFAGFAYFAFMLTLMREVVKDMEDYIGDAEEGCVTMPIKKGLQYSARFVQTIGGITIVTLALITYYLFLQGNRILGIYTIGFVLFPLTWWCFFIIKKNTVQHYHTASKWLKIIMVSGIASLVVYHFTNLTTHA